MDCNYLIAGLIGGLVGAIELISRYRDNPWAAVREKMAWFYMGVNFAAALVAYHLVTTFNVYFGFDPKTEPDKLVTMQVLISAFSAMAFFRTALFTTRVAETDVPVGPGLAFQVLLDATDRAVDRRRALPRAEDIPKLMAPIDFDKAVAALPTFCFGLMQNISPADQSAAGEEFATLANRPELDPSLKSYLLGLMLVNLVGIDVLEAAVNALGEKIKLDPSG